MAGQATPAPLHKRDLQKKLTAQTILQAAKKLFAEQGFDSTTTRAIATEAGIAYRNMGECRNLWGKISRDHTTSLTGSSNSTSFVPTFNTGYHASK